MSTNDENLGIITFPSYRVPLLQDIDPHEEHYLLEFLHKLRSEKTRMNPNRLKKLHDRCFDVHFILHDISLVAMRINEDCKQVNRREELFDLVTKQNRVLTTNEEDELENLRYAVDYLNLDVRTLLVNVVVFMDTLAKFLNWTIKTERQLRNRNFVDFRKDLNKYDGKEILKIRQLLIGKSQWFGQVKELRDAFIIHHAAARSGLEIHGEETHIPLTTSKGGFPRNHILFDAVAKTIKMKKLDDILSDVKDLLKELNAFLCKQIDQLPFKTKIYD